MAMVGDSGVNMGQLYMQKIHSVPVCHIIILFTFIGQHSLPVNQYSGGVTVIRATCHWSFTHEIEFSLMSISLDS